MSTKANNDSLRLSLILNGGKSIRIAADAVGAVQATFTPEKGMSLSIAPQEQAVRLIEAGLCTHAITLPEGGMLMIDTSSQRDNPASLSATIPVMSGYQILAEPQLTQFGKTIVNLFLEGVEKVVIAGDGDPTELKPGEFNRIGVIRIHGEANRTKVTIHFKAKEVEALVLEGFAVFES